MGYRKKLSGLSVTLLLAAALAAGAAGCGVLPPSSDAGDSPALTVVQEALEVTVGEDGRFPTLNEALEYCSGFYPAYRQEGLTVTVRILEGTVLREQVVCSGVDLSYITITADQSDRYPAVPVEHDASWTGDRDESRYNKPFLEANNGGRLPMIGCVFTLASACSDASGYVCGMLCDKGSAGIILDGGGFIGFFDGIIANNNSEITCRNGILQNCGRYAAHARHISRISVRGADLSGAGQCAVYANRVSSVDARAAWMSDCRNGFLAVNDSTINANDATAQGLWGDYVAAADALSSVNCGQMTVEDYYGNGPAFQVSNGSELALHGLCGNVLWLEEGGRLYSQQPNTLTGEGVIYMGETEGVQDP